jgi:hypothetical protein
MIELKCSSKLCVSNYTTHRINDIHGIFQGSPILLNSQEIILILFNSPKYGQFIKTKNAHLYEHEIHPTWTSTKPISKNIQIGSNSSHIITNMQFSIQFNWLHHVHTLSARIDV